MIQLKITSGKLPQEKLERPDTKVIIFGVFMYFVCVTYVMKNSAQNGL